MKSLLILVVAVAVSAPALSIQAGQTGEVPLSQNELKSLPPINLQDFAGKTVPTDQFKGKILVVDFWATWCVPCIEEVPKFNRLQQKYGDQGVQVIGVTLASGDAKEVKPFVTRNKMKYAIYIGDDDQVYDLNVIAFPTTYVVTRDLKVFRRYIGTSPGKAAGIEADIQKLLASN
ncbi:MAG TPA: TlpA disulfide reductase family protein [Blastocatellia bacterium]|nr:TlpA disulfide reductase family protein [Blastocatellia bacterium]